MSDLPTWFLVLSLLLPRVAIVCAYFGDVRPVASLDGLMPAAMVAIFPRVVVILLIYSTLGWSWWLILHAAAMFGVYSSVGSRSAR